MTDGRVEGKEMRGNGTSGLITKRTDDGWANESGGRWADGVGVGVGVGGGMGEGWGLGGRMG